MKTGRIIAVLAVSLLAGLVLVGLGCAPIYPSVIHATPAHFGAQNSQAVIGIQMSSAYAKVMACLSVTEKQAMTFAEGEIRRIAGEGGPDCTWDDTTAILQGRPLYGPDDRCNGYVCRLTTGGMETGYLQVDALGGELCTGAYSFDGIPAYEGLAEEGGGTASGERLYFFGGISYGVRLEDGSFRLMGSPERVSAETAAEQYRRAVEQVQRQRAE